VQYTSGALRKVAGDHGVLLSVGRTGVCWDNALAESFFATLKNELIYRRPWPTQAGVRGAVITWIEGRYNRTRRTQHSTCSAPSSSRTAHDTLPLRQRDPCPPAGVKSSLSVQLG